MTTPSYYSLRPRPARRRRTTTWVVLVVAVATVAGCWASLSRARDEQRYNNVQVLVVDVSRPGRAGPGWRSAVVEQPGGRRGTAPVPASAVPGSQVRAWVDTTDGSVWRGPSPSSTPLGPGALEVFLLVVCTAGAVAGLVAAARRFHDGRLLAPGPPGPLGRAVRRMGDDR